MITKHSEFEQGRGAVCGVDGEPRVVCKRPLRGLGGLLN